MLVELGQIMIDGFLGQAFPTSQDRQAGIDRDAVQPGLETGALLEAVEGPEGVLKSVLDGIFGQRPLPQHALGESQHPTHVVLHHLLGRWCTSRFREPCLGLFGAIVLHYSVTLKRALHVIGSLEAVLLQRCRCP